MVDRFVEVNGTGGAEPDMAVRVAESGQNPATVKYRLGVRHRLGRQRAAVPVLVLPPLIDDPPLNGLLVGQPAAAYMQAHARYSSRKRSSPAISCRGSSASTDRNPPGQAVTRPAPPASRTDRGSRPASPRPADRAPSAVSVPALPSSPSFPCRPWLFASSCVRTASPSGRQFRTSSGGPRRPGGPAGGHPTPSRPSRWRSATGAKR